MKKTDIYSAFLRFQDIPFPRGLSDDEVYEIKVDCVEYDGYMAGLISSYAQGKEENKEKIIYDSSFEERLLKRLKQKPELQNEIEPFLNYLSKIKELVEMVQQS